MTDCSKKNALQELGDSANDSLFLPEKYQPQFMHYQLIGDTISVMIWHGGDVGNSGTSLYLKNCNSYWNMEQLLNNLRQNSLIAKRVILSVGYKECRTKGFDIRECVSKLKSIIAILRNRGCEEIILTNVPPCAGACRKLIHWKCLQAMNQAMKTLNLEENDIVLCNIFQLFCDPVNVKRRQEYVIDNAPNYIVHFDLYNAKSPHNPAVNDLISFSNKGKIILAEHLRKTINYRVEKYLTKLINARLNFATSNKRDDTNNNTSLNKNKCIDISSTNNTTIDKINASASKNQKLNNRDKPINNISKPNTSEHNKVLAFPVKLTQTGIITRNIQKPLLTQEDENKTEKVHVNPNLSKANAHDDKPSELTPHPNLKLETELTQHDNKPSKLTPHPNLKLKTELTQTKNEKTQPTSRLPPETDLTRSKNKETQLSKSLLLETNFAITRNEEILPNPKSLQNKETQPGINLPLKNGLHLTQNKGTLQSISLPLVIDLTGTQDATTEMIRKKSTVAESKITQVSNCLPSETNNLMDSSNKKTVMNSKEFITKYDGKKPKLPMNTNLEKVTADLNLEGEPDGNVKLCNENSRFSYKKIKLILNKSPVTDQVLKSITSQPNSKVSIPKKVDLSLKRIPSAAYTIPKISNACSIPIEKETEQWKNTHKKEVIIEIDEKKLPKSNVVMKGNNSVKPEAVHKIDTRSPANLGTEKIHSTLTENGMKKDNGVNKRSLISLDANHDEKKDTSATNCNNTKVKKKVFSKSASEDVTIKEPCTEITMEPPTTFTEPQYHHLPKLNTKTEMELFLKSASTETKKRKNVEGNSSTERHKAQKKIFLQHNFICNCKVCEEGHKKLTNSFHNLIKILKKEQETND